MIGLELRKRIVEAYLSGRTRSYEATAELFGVGRATVSRLLRRHRETGDVKPLPIGGNYPRQVDLDGLREHARAHPDARLVDRIDDWEAQSGRRVASSTMSKAMRTLGWTHKKKRRSRTSESARMCSPSALSSSSCSPPRSSTDSCSSMNPGIGWVLRLATDGPRAGWTRRAMGSTASGKRSRCLEPSPSTASAA